MPFLQVFFRTYYAPDRENFADEADRVDKLANTMMVRFLSFCILYFMTIVCNVPVFSVSVGEAAVDEGLQCPNVQAAVDEGLQCPSGQCQCQCEAAVDEGLQCPMQCSVSVSVRGCS
jgi:hypothetical protein